jgi:hypothetical protein
MPGRVFFVCHHPGGANAILPVLIALRDRGGYCEGMVSQLSQGVLSSCFPSTYLMDDRVREDFAIDTIRKFNPDLVVLGTSEPEDLVLGKPEAVFAFVAQKQKIPSISVLDFWSGYRARFSLPGSVHLDALPDAICVMDERAKEKMVAEGFPDKLLFVTGNPYWDHLGRVKRELDCVNRQVLKRGMGIVGRKLILFISQPLSGLRNWHGQYDEHKALEKLSESVALVCEGDEVDLWVKPHPREDKAALSEAIRSSGIRARVMDAGEEAYRTGRAADLIIGMFSMLLVEFALLGLPVVSFQPVVKSEDAFHLGFGIKTIVTEDELHALLLTSWIPQISRPSIEAFKATEEVLEVIELNCNYRTRL